LKASEIEGIPLVALAPVVLKIGIFAQPLEKAE
jgi:hypothetical protein